MAVFANNVYLYIIHMFSGFKLKLAYQRINEDTIQYSTNGQHSLNDLEYSVA